MKIVAVNSLCGGAGATTVVANLSHALELLGCRTLCIDLNPANLLALQFGIDPLHRGGWAASVVAGERIGDAVWQSDDGRRILPFGQLSREDLTNLDGSDADIVARICRQDIADIDTVILDGPSGLPEHFPASLQRVAEAATNAAVLRIWVIAADPRSYATLHRNLPASGDVQLLNRYRPECMIDSDIATVLRYEFDGGMVPVVLPEDASAPEAAACQRSVISHAPASQLAADFRALGVWCRSQLESR